MSEITSTVYGIAPWSGERLTISGDIRRGRRPEDDLQTQSSADFGIYSGVLEAAGIDYRSGDWAGGTEDYLRDITRLFTQRSKGRIKAEELTRWFDTNTFYRQPVLTGWPQKISPYPHAQYQDWLKLTGSDGRYQPTFLSPYAFAKLAGKAEGITEGEAWAFTGELYDQLLSEAWAENIDGVLLHEPFIPYSQAPVSERARFVSTMGKLAEFHEPLKISLFFSYGDASDVMNDLTGEDVPIAGIGADLQQTPLSRIRSVGSRIFLAGLIDGANTFFRSSEELASEASSVSAAQPQADISVTHTVDLEHVPRPYAVQKIKQIGQVAALVRGEN